MRTGFSRFPGQTGLVEKLGRCLLPMVEIFVIKSIEYDNDKHLLPMVEIFDINSIAYSFFFFKKILTLCLDYICWPVLAHVRQT